MSTDLNDRNTLANVCDLYHRGSSVIADYNHACDSETLDSLHSTLCIHMYGSELWIGLLFTLIIYYCLEKN